MVLAKFLPQDQRFFQQFCDSANNAGEAAAVLLDLLTNYEDVERKVGRIRDLEHQGDEITHQVFHALNSTFVTPLDREDIRDLASKLDDFIDYIEEAAKRLPLYRIEQPTALAVMFARIINDQAKVLSELMSMLAKSKNRDTMLRHTVEINRLENEADALQAQALAGLFEGVNDIPGVILAIRWQELYQLLEDATDRAEDVANTVEGIVLKHA